METNEWFCGKKSMSNVLNERGHRTFTIDNDKSFNPDLCIDVLNMVDGNHVDLFWASPPCTTFSVASISTHWKGGKNAYIPKSKEAIIGLKILEKTIKNISISKPNIWFIENPRGVMRKVIDDIFKKYNIKDYRRVTVTYCQYGDTRMKPTDIWTNNMTWIPRPMCKNGDSCHVSAPRGSKTGTQGLKGAKERSVIPKELCLEIIKDCESSQKRGAVK
jgi:hypothetical protein